MIRDSVKEAVKDVFEECTQTFAKEMARAFASEMAKSLNAISSATTRLIEAGDRYVRGKNKDVEKGTSDLENTMDQSNDSYNSDFDVTSTPLPSGRRKGEKPSDSPTRPPAAPAVPILEDLDSAFKISLPAIHFNIPKNKSETEIAKIIQDEVSSKAKMLRRDMQVIQNDILGKLEPNPSPTPPRGSPSTLGTDPTKRKPRRGRPAKESGTAPQATRSSSRSQKRQTTSSSTSQEISKVNQNG